MNPFRDEFLIGNFNYICISVILNTDMTYVIEFPTL